MTYCYYPPEHWPHWERLAEWTEQVSLLKWTAGWIVDNEKPSELGNWEVLGHLISDAANTIERQKREIDNLNERLERRGIKKK